MQVQPYEKIFRSSFSEGDYKPADFTTYIGDGNINMSGSASDTGTTYTTEIIGVAVDVDNEKNLFL